MNARRPVFVDWLVNRTARVIVVLAVVHSLFLQSEQAVAAEAGGLTYRVGVATDRFNDATQVTVSKGLRAPRRLRARRLDLTAGVTTTPGDTRGLISLGPAWRYPADADRGYVEFGFAPTLLLGSTFGERDMGGFLHFTSSAEVGVHFGSRSRGRIALRIQHTSNGGLDSTNPGMDVISLSFSYDVDAANAN